MIILAISKHLIFLVFCGKLPFYDLAFLCACMCAEIGAVPNLHQKYINLVYWYTCHL